jgi:nitroreductase
MITPEQVNKLIKDRRSVFQAQYSGERVPDAVIEQMLENANWAPNHKHTEPWRFIVFTDAGIERFAEVQAEVYKQVHETRGTFDEARYKIMREKPRLSSHIIAIAMKRDEKKSVPQIEEIGAVFCAVENMYLTATAYGVGCYLSTGTIAHYEEAKPAFGLGEEDVLIGFLHVGMPKGPLPEGKRRPIADKVVWER